MFSNLKILPIVAAALLLGSSAMARIYITVSDAQVKKSNLAFVSMSPLPGSQVVPKRLLKDLRKQFMEDLAFMNLFNFVNRERYLHLDGPDYLTRIRYQDWGLTGAQFVLKVGYKLARDRLVLEAYMYDIPGRAKILSNRYEHPASSYKALVHALSENILTRLTGEEGLFRSRISMVCRGTRKQLGKIAKEIFVAEPDGSKFKQVTFDNTLSLSPAWSADGLILSYTQYQRRVRRNKNRRELKTIPLLKAHHVKTGRRKILSEKDGMNSGAAWSPDNQTVALTLSHTGRPEIYIMNATGEGEPTPLSRNLKLRRLSGEGFQPNFPSLLFDVEPSWAPDGKQLVFSSARSGKPMIYVTDVVSKLTRQLTFAGRYNSSPAWSPKGDKILFSAQHHSNGNFDIYLIDPDGNNLARLTAGGKSGAKKTNYEDASWAPTGRHFAYTSNEGGIYRVYARTMEGNIIRQISPKKLECTMPAWSPKLP